MVEKLKAELLMSFAKQGPWALCFILLAVVFYNIAIVPMADERALLVKTLRESNIVLTENTTVIADSMVRMEIGLSDFTKQVMKEDHPYQTKLLESIDSTIKQWGQ